MRTHTPAKRLWLATAAVMAAAAITLGVAYQGNATAQTGPPDPPTNPLARLIVPDDGAPRIRVSWDASETVVTGYTVTRDDGQEVETAGAATTFSDHTVAPGTTYSYSVAANNAHGTGPVSATASASVPDAPSMPGDFAVSVAELQPADEAPTVSLTWNTATVPDVPACDVRYPLDGYTIWRDNDGVETEVGAPDSDATSFTDTTAAFGASYTYRIAAQSAIGHGPTAAVTVTTPKRPVAPPSGLTATIADPFDGTVSLSWTAPSEGPSITGYQVLRDDAALADNITANTHDDDTAQAGVAYTYAVKARSADNISAASASVTIEAPAPPSDLKTTLNDAAINLAWKAPTAGTVVGYRVERKQQGGQWATIANPTSNSHADTTAAANVYYTYRVQHRNAHGGSTWVESQPVTRLTAPGRPTGLSATVSGNDNVLSWTAPTDSIVEAYRVKHRTDEGTWSELAEDIAGNTYTHEATAADVAHEYAVQAYNSAGPGPWSETDTATRVTPPTEPTALSATVSNDDIVLTWTRPNSVHIDSYTVRHRTDDSASYTETPDIAADATSHTLESVAGDVTYHLSVRAHNSAGDSVWPEDVTAMRRLAPSQPTSVQATAGDMNIVVSWGPSATGAADGYRVRYGVASSAERDTAAVDGDTTAFTHTGTREGVEYVYRVQAHNTAGESDWSEPVTATRTLAPGQPTDVRAAASGSVIIVSWHAPDSAVIDGYDVRYGASGSDATVTESVAGDATRFIHADPAGDTSYGYEVRSRNSAGTSDWTTAITAMVVVPPLRPTGVGTTVSNERIVVSWNAPASGIIDGYQVEYRQLERPDWTRADAAATSYTHADPTAGVTYEYRVRAVNSGGVSDWTQPVNEVWFRGAAPPIVNKIRGLGNNVMVTWQPSTTEGVTGYRVRSRIDGGQWQTADLPASPQIIIPMPTWSADQARHEYSMQSLIGDVAGDWSPVRQAVIAQPAPVTGLRVYREGDTAVRVHWVMPQADAPNLFVIEASANGGDFRQVGVATGYDTNDRVQHPHGEDRVYRVRGMNHVNVRSAVEGSATVSFNIPTPPPQDPAAVSNLRVEMVDAATPRLTWDAPERHRDQTIGYRIYRREASDAAELGSAWRHVLAYRISANSYTDYDARADTAYEYGVMPYRKLTPAVGPMSRTVYATTW